ncbi:hypothetical protein [Actinoplanes palleronii]|uniref:TPR repeat protein n=1 Tax=Actinoplanes palleronii TaxID=113570 RepID=A0ABQ4BRY2_9ACTN|nr:hypothetical protein [Actinoplanes palleronii]GIE73031.1 hypothetical protein Apa02nite_091390 [Actinoplanes palleronii]
MERAVLSAGPSRELRDAIYHLYAQADCPRLEELAKVIAADDSLPAVPKKDVIGKVIGGDSLATKRDCIAIAVALAQEAGRADTAAVSARVHELWIAARLATAPTTSADSGEALSSLGRPISACDPFALEVHRAIDASADSGRLPPLPLYVERPHDRQMRAIADQSLNGSSRMITMVGGSSTGKTRACWELVQYIERQQPGRWRVWHPYDPSRSEAAAEEISEVGAYSIVWLNEAQSYLAPSDQPLGERVAAGLRTLLTDRLRRPVLILATMWPEPWTTLRTRPDEDGLVDPHGQARELLDGTDIDVPGAFTSADLADLNKHDDPRLRHAGMCAAGGRITQYLAGAPQLLDRYQKAPPAARAVLDVAIDARRLGFLPAIPYALLQEAAPGYLDDDEWDRLGPDWFEHALTYAAATCNGTRGLLTPVRPRPGEPTLSGDPVYRLADYIEQTGIKLRARCYPPSSFWQAASATIDDATALQVLGWAAEQRGRYQHAFCLYRASVLTGTLGAFRPLLRLLRQVDAPHSAAELCRRAAALGNTDALNVLAFTHERAGDLRRAASLYRQGADRGDPQALHALARLSAEAGDSDAAVRLDGAAAESDDATRLTFAQRGERAGDLDRAPDLNPQAIDRSRIATARDSGTIPVARVRRQAADRTATSSLIKRVHDSRRAGDLDAAIAAARQAAERGHTGVLGNLALHVEQHGDLNGAVDLAHEAADGGNPIVLSQLARRRELVGDPDGAADLYREAANRGNLNAVVNLARLSEKGGDNDSADKIRKYGLDAGGLAAEPWCALAASWAIRAESSMGRTASDAGDLDHPALAQAE